MAPKLTPKQRRFVQELMVDENAKQAAIRAGYSPVGAETRGPYLARQAHIKAAIDVARKELAERMVLRQDQVLAELKCIIYADPRKAFDADGNPLPIHQLPEELARALAATEVRVESVPGETLDDGHETKARAVAAVKKLVFASKVKGLELAMKHLGMLDKKKDEGDGEGVTVNINLEGKGSGHAQ